MNDASIEFNTQLELDVLLNGLTVINGDYVSRFDWAQLDEIVIPDGVKDLGDLAFHMCGGITDVTISDSVISIGYAAFAHCYNLTHITIPDSVICIGNYAFQECHRLRAITIPGSVVSIGRDAFWKCDYLTDLMFKDRKLNEISSIEGYPWGLYSGQISVQDA